MTAPVARDTVFEVLSNNRRRFIISTLRQRDDPVELTTLAREIGAHEADIDPSAVDSTEQKRVYVSLYQTHIPKLESAGFVRYDEETRTVAAMPAVTEVDRYLGPVQSALPWSRLNGALSLVVGGLFLGTLFEISVLTGVSPLLLASAIVVVLLVVAVAQLVDHRRCQRARPLELRDP